jgi:hypothetical protein
MLILSALVEAIGQGFHLMLDDAQNVFTHQSGHEKQLHQNHTTEVHQA